MSATAPTRAAGACVDVWAIATGGAPRAEDLALLAPGERAHADRRRADGAAWARVRAALRRVLAEVLAVAPAQVTFAAEPGGRPVVANAPDVHFSVSHTSGLALVAVSTAAPVGVDVERIRDGVDAAAVAALAFEAPEHAALRAAPGDRRAAFFRAWVRHEALAKAAGVGLTGERPALAGDWTVRDLYAGACYAAALATTGTDWSMRIRVPD